MYNQTASSREFMTILMGVRELELYSSCITNVSYQITDESGHVQVIDLFDLQCAGYIAVQNPTSVRCIKE